MEEESPRAQKKEFCSPEMKKTEKLKDVSEKNKSERKKGKLQPEEQKVF